MCLPMSDIGLAIAGYNPASRGSWAASSLRAAGPVFCPSVRPRGKNPARTQCIYYTSIVKKMHSEGAGFELDALSVVYHYLPDDVLIKDE